MGRRVQLAQPITTFTMMAFPTKKLWEAIQNAYESDSDDRDGDATAGAAPESRGPR